MKDQQKAIQSYQEALRLSNNDFESFYKAFNDDIHYLLKYGINAIDISLMKDYLKRGFFKLFQIIKLLF